MILLLAFRGVLRGFFREFCGVAALVAGATAALLWGGRSAQWLAGQWDVAGNWGVPAGYAAAFLVPYAVLRGAGAVLHRLGRAVFLGGLDRAAGGVFGAAAAAILAGAVCAGAQRIPWAAAWIEGSRLAGPLAEAFSGAMAVVGR